METFKKLPYDIQSHIYNIYKPKHEYDKVMEELQGVIGDTLNYFGVKLYYYDDEIDEIMDGKNQQENIGEYLLLFLHDDIAIDDFYED